MKITKETKYYEVKNILTEENFEEIKSKVSDEDLEAAPNLTNIDVGTFLSLSMGDEKEVNEYLLQGKRENEITVYDYAVRTLKLKTEIEKIFALLNSFNTNSEKEKQAAHGINFPSFVQSTLIFCMEKFRRKNFEEAGEVKLYEFIAMRKSEAAQAKFNKQYIELR